MREYYARAELVYDLLSDDVIHRGKVPVLFACNKQDNISLAKGCSAIKTQLEIEGNVRLGSIKAQRILALSPGFGGLT